MPVLEGIDQDAWKADRNACTGNRAEMANAIEQQKDKLLALDEKQIITLLGPPDKNELYTRNQKFYSYYLTPAPACGDESPDPKILEIRFNAMGLAKEINIQ